MSFTQEQADANAEAWARYADVTVGRAEPKPERCRHDMRREWCADCRREDAAAMACGTED